jgi:hypothetical protein
MRPDPAMLEHLGQPVTAPPPSTPCGGVGEELPCELCKPVDCCSSPLPSIWQTCRHYKTWQRAELRLFNHIWALENPGVRRGKGAKKVKVRLKGPDATEEVCLPLYDAYSLLTAKRKGAEKVIKALTATLPIAVWLDDVPGVDVKSLGLLIGETDDLWLYANPAKLRKRMGLMPGQRKVADNPELATALGYSPRRRALMHIIATNLIMVSHRQGRYYEIYSARKAMELAKGLRPIVADKRAKRVMAQKFLVDLWVEWRRRMPKPEGVGGDPIDLVTQTSCVSPSLDESIGVGPVDFCNPKSKCPSDALVGGR